MYRSKHVLINNLELIVISKMSGLVDFRSFLNDEFDKIFSRLWNRGTLLITFRSLGTLSMVKVNGSPSCLSENIFRFYIVKSNVFKSVKQLTFLFIS